MTSSQRPPFAPSRFVLPSTGSLRRPFLAVLLLALAASLLASAAFAQPSISVDYQGPSSIPFGGPSTPAAFT